MVLDHIHAIRDDICSETNGIQAWTNDIKSNIHFLCGRWGKICDLERDISQSVFSVRKHLNSFFLNHSDNIRDDFCETRQKLFVLWWEWSKIVAETWYNLRIVHCWGWLPIFNNACDNPNMYSEFKIYHVNILLNELFFIVQNIWHKQPIFCQTSKHTTWVYYRAQICRKGAIVMKVPMILYTYCNFSQSKYLTPNETLDT